MISARIRRDIGHFAIPAKTLDGKETKIFTSKAFDAEQPDLIEDMEYNTIVSIDNEVLLVQSIDLEFEPFH